MRVFSSPKVILGRDTRVSGPLFESAIAAGVCSEGADAVSLGVVPTPTVAAGSARDGVPGVVISASHNPFADNGIKIFAPGGRKLTDAEQRGVEDAIAAVLDGDRHEGPSGAGIGSIVTDPTVVDSYSNRVIGAVEGRTLAGLKVVVDCANGAASTVGPDILRRLGADITVIADRPDGRNINEGCGSTHPDELQTAVAARGADLGVAFDGDADRVLAVDGRGDLVDGDQIIALCATDLQARGPPRAGHGRGDRDDEPRVPQGDGEAGRHGRRHRRGRPLRPRGALRRWLHAGRGTVRPHHLPGPRDHG